MEVFINGRFLSQSLTGVPRYAAEITKAIDGLLSSGEVPEHLRGAHWALLTPPNTIETLDLVEIETLQVGTLTGHAWDQLDLAWAARAGALLSLANAGPVAHRDHVVVLHDAQVFRKPDVFNRPYRMLHRALGFLLSRTARIGTVS